MANAISGNVTVQSSLSQTLDAGANRPVAYTVPVSFNPQHTYGSGTGANQANGIYYLAGSAAASPVTFDLTAVVRLDGVTGFSHVREILFYNTSGTDGQIFTFTEISNFFAPWAGGTSPTEAVQAGAAFIKSKPLGTAGWVVDSTHKILEFDPGANTVPYVIIVVGD